MSILGTIMSKILGKTPATSAASAAASPAPSATKAAANAPVASPAPMPSVDVAAVLNALKDKATQQLNWKISIVDLMKLLSTGQQSYRAQGAGEGVALHWGHK